MLNLTTTQPLPEETIRQGYNEAVKCYTNRKRFHLGFKLLTPPNGNTKLNKSSIPTYGLSLAPAASSGYQLCPSRSAECESACLGKSGRGKMSCVQQARIRKTHLLAQDPEVFFSTLFYELGLCTARHGWGQWAFRSNVISDVSWFTIAPIIYTFGSINYDYTKRPELMDAVNRNDDVDSLGNPCNKKQDPQLHLTFSYSGWNLDHCLRFLNEKKNVSVVCSNYEDVLNRGYCVFPNDPKQTKFNVISGDITDERFKDPKGSVVILSPKGKVQDSKFIIKL